MFQGIYSNKCHEKNWKKYLNTDCRVAMYKSFISSNFSYCLVSWMFCGKRNSGKLEKLQERGLCFIFSDYTRPYSDLLKHGSFLSLSALRIRYLAIEMFKCVHDLNPLYLNELFINKDTPYNVRDSNRLQQPEYKTVRYGFKSFRYYGSKLWNTLPTEVKQSENLYHLNKNITDWCVSGKCDMYIIQWYMWYIALYTKFIVSFYRFYLCSTFINLSLPGTPATGVQFHANLEVFRFLYTFTYHLFILSKINWQFVLLFVSEPMCTFEYMLNFIEPLRFVC